MIKEALLKLVERIDLEEDEIIGVANLMMQGELGNAEISAFLVALRMKGETIPEITGVAKSLISKAKKIKPNLKNVVDLCGTGGDNRGTFNISTTAAFIVAGAGIPVAKHGNRSVSSPVGSADVLEELGVNINISPEVAEQCLNEEGIVFMFAPLYHSAMKHVASTRKEIGIRTIFNLIGPLVNPASVEHQLVGVYSETLIEPIAKVLRNLGSKRAMVVHGADSMDEITITGKTSVAELKEGVVKTYQIDPIDLGINQASLEDIKGGNSAKENAEITLSILKGEDTGPKKDVAVLNAAGSILVSEGAADLKEAVDIANNSIFSGNSLKKLEQLSAFTQANSSK